MKMRNMYYLYISMDSSVKIVRLLNNIVVSAKKTLVLSENDFSVTACTPSVFTQVAFSENINFGK